jgi:imidazolonepropionase
VIDVDLVVRGASELLTCHGPPTGVRRPVAMEVIADGAVAVRDGTVVAVGPTADIDARYRAPATIDATGRLVTPGLVDPHTHLVHAGSRHHEWEHRVAGTPWTARPAGIASTVAATRAATDGELTARAVADLDVALAHGTTTLEAKSGYGLDRDTEMRLLHIAARLDHSVEVVPTFLGAHVVPPEMADRREEYVQRVIEMLPDARPLAAWCDVWCDPAAFSAAEAGRILAAARDAGFGIRVHADQTGWAGGTGLAVRAGAASVDHLDEASDADLALLGPSDTVAVLLPGCTLHLLQAADRDWPAWARRVMDSGAVVALSTDYNPGSCPTLSMPMVMALAARLYRLRTAEIWYGATLNAAAALRRADRVGSLAPGQQADLVLWSVPEHGMVVHRFGTNLVDTVVKRGRVVVSGGAVVPA